MEREKRIAAVVEAEWHMFTSVQNEGGRASCQDDWPTFSIMRSSQMHAWADDTLASYLADLTEAKAQGRNLPQEKYAWMMASTQPEAFAKLEPHLPAQSAEKRALVEALVAHQLSALEAMRPVYPHILAAMRKLRTAEDTPWETSFETYQRGELYTYSMQTLQCYQVQLMRTDYGRVILEDMARQYGFESLEALEAALAVHA